MTQIIEFFADMVSRSAAELDKVGFDVMGVDVSFFDLMLSFAALCIIIAVFWRGVRK